MLRYLSDRAVPVLEASVFGSQWEYVWGKLPEVSPDDRLSTVKNVYLYTLVMFSDDIGASTIGAPTFALRRL